MFLESFYNPYFDYSFHNKVKINIYKIQIYFGEKWYFQLNLRFVIKESINHMRGHYYYEEILSCVFLKKYGFVLI